MKLVIHIIQEISTSSDKEVTTTSKFGVTIGTSSSEIMPLDNSVSTPKNEIIIVSKSNNHYQTPEVNALKNDKIWP